MSKLLLISNNDFLNILYTVNLEVYLNTSVSLALSIEDGIELIKKNHFDLILANEILNDEDAGLAVYSFLKSHGKNIPLVVSGALENATIDPNYIKLAGKFNIQSILKTCAKILGVTAKQMSELNVGSFYPISTDALSGIDKAPCPIYQKPSANKVLVDINMPFESTIENLEKEGIKKVYVNSGDRLVVINKISLSLIDKISDALKNLENATVEKKIQVLSDSYDFASFNLFSSDEIKQQMQEIAKSASVVMGDVANTSSSFKALLNIMLLNKDGYIFTHSMITSYVASYLIRNVTWGGGGQLEKINFVLFFHDIYLAPLYLKHPSLKDESNLLSSELLTEQEKEIVLNHARLAAELVVSYKRCPLGADVLIKQHHGMKKGRGFATVYLEDLSPLSKIILVAEVFVEELLLNSDNQKASLVSKTIIPKLIREFKSPSYTKLVELLAKVPL